MQYQHAGPVTNYSSGGMVAPVTGTQNAAVLRAEVKQGVREVIACKGPDGKVGLRVRAVNKGVFISFVQAGSAASLAGLRFGDQILQINGETLAGYDNDKVMKILKKASAQEIRFAVRDRLAPACFWPKFMCIPPSFPFKYPQIYVLMVKVCL